MVVDRIDDVEAESLLTDSSECRSPNASTSKRLSILIVCGILVLAADFGFYLSQAPQTALFEQIICRTHGIQSRGAVNATADIPNEGDPCKSEVVQGELALVLGYKDTFEVLPGAFKGQ